ncbi:hypothetical protein ES288_D03G195300v1 [Gossypium darwinii]|uniref:Uncharacterized protein n=1 Tax=Gossypium darwinii TaxID=34276 RepID=A0A5D2D7U0_GOSDA|nr:hypothetical protein ES288_D03G195300v1 [Gossypium darwinii]
MDVLPLSPQPLEPPSELLRSTRHHVFAEILPWPVDEITSHQFVYACRFKLLYYRQGVAFYFHKPETHLLSDSDCLDPC